MMAQQEEQFHCCTHQNRRIISPRQLSQEGSFFNCCCVPRLSNFLKPEPTPSVALLPKLKGLRPVVVSQQLCCVQSEMCDHGDDKNFSFDVRQMLSVRFGWLHRRRMDDVLQLVSYYLLLNSSVGFGNAQVQHAALPDLIGPKTTLEQPKGGYHISDTTILLPRFISYEGVRKLETLWQKPKTISIGRRYLPFDVVRSMWQMCFCCSANSNRDWKGIDHNCFSLSILPIGAGLSKGFEAEQKVNVKRVPVSYSR